MRDENVTKPDGFDSFNLITPERRVEFSSLIPHPSSLFLLASTKRKRTSL
jgi:hypothetical protein